uniref:Radial spoke head protein 4 homolog A-like n=1 Tax=Diabrotica virgifera virgifera TaxID=50390 RepID=A0A6P7FVJ9_DIAVI
MITDFEIEEAEEQPGDARSLPQYETEFTNAKIFLQKASTDTGENLYDHLSETLNKILAERPQNVIDFFEDFSRKIKEKRFRPHTDHLEDIYVAPNSLALAQKMMPLLKPLPASEPSTMDPADLELADMSQNNLLELLYYFEQCGLGLPRKEMFFVMLSIKKLSNTEPISSISPFFETAFLEIENKKLTVPIKFNSKGSTIV